LLLGPRNDTPLERLLGSGLDARQFTDLATLTAETLLIENERFFVRTACPAAAESRDTWSVRISGLVDHETSLSLGALRGLARPMGVHLLECAGNVDPANFGLMSAAEWEGVSLSLLLGRIRARPEGARVLVTGVDETRLPTRTSEPGASWIFSREEIESTGAFLATGMNGAPLPRHHGFPLRLVVPGWYACCSIKWVDGITLVPEDAPATPHMLEFAARTHQTRRPVLAREFEPAVIDPAAFPVRVEKWNDSGRIVHRVVGILWGGSQPRNDLLIGFRSDQPFVPVEDCPLPRTTATWSLWSHIWRPSEPGVYQIVLRLADPTVRTRRLERFHYAREVAIETE
jgi:DMSO/TMAO reductase YedYZ molybdopterin-dependent catalytic subunit